MAKRKQPNEGESSNPEKKSRRRGKGEGSVYHRKSDGRWVASISLEDGTRKEYYFKTEKEAIEKKTHLLYELQQGLLATGPQQTVKQFMEYWLEDVHKPTINISSYILYRAILDNHILPSLGHMRVQKLTVQQVEAFYARKAKEQKSASTIASIHAVLHRALSHAVYINLIGRNVCDIAKKSLPRQTRHDIQALTKEQAQKLLQFVQGQKLEAVLTLALTTGMRRGELVALRWQDINFDERYLQVCRSARRSKGYGIVVSEPKTRSGRRKIELSSSLIGILQRHKARQEKRRRAIGNAWIESGLVFCNRQGGILDPEYLTLMFKNVLKKAGLPPIRFHDLRHSAATLLLAIGTHPKIVQDLLGHSNITMTLNVYSHVLPSLQKDAIDKLSRLFEPQSEQQEGIPEKQQQERNDEQHA